MQFKRISFLFLIKKKKKPFRNYLLSSNQYHVYLQNIIMILLYSFIHISIMDLYTAYIQIVGVTRNRRR